MSPEEGKNEEASNTKECAIGFSWEESRERRKQCRHRGNLKSARGEYDVGSKASCAIFLEWSASTF